MAIESLCVLVTCRDGFSCDIGNCFEDPLVSLCSVTSPVRMATIRTKLVVRSVNVHLQRTHVRA